MIKNIVLGIKEYTGAFTLISDLKLWKYFIVPILISILTAILIGVEVYVLYDNVGGVIAKLWIWDWGKEGFTAISNFVGGIIVLVIGLILYKHIFMEIQNICTEKLAIQNS